MRKLVGLVAAVAVLVGAAVVYAQTNQTVQTLDVKIKPAKASSKKKQRGITLDVTTATSNQDGSKHSPTTRAVVFFPKGLKFNDTKFPTCSQSALENSGPSACPKKSLIGTGSADVDARPVIGDPIHGDTMGFNAKGHKILLYTTTTTPIQTATTIVGTLKKASGKYGSKLDVVVPPLPTLPGQPNATITRFELKTKATIKKKGKTYNYVVAPTTCKKSWPFNSQFTFEDGTTASAKTTVKCKKA